MATTSLFLKLVVNKIEVFRPFRSWKVNRDEELKLITRSENTNDSVWKVNELHFEN